MNNSRPSVSGEQSRTIKSACTANYVVGVIVGVLIAATGGWWWVPIAIVGGVLSAAFGRVAVDAINTKSLRSTPL